MTIIEFLTARYDVAEKIARTAFATGEDWVAYQDPYGNTRVTGMSGAFVLRDIAAKRAIVELHVLSSATDVWGREVDGIGCEVCDVKPDLMLGGTELEATGGCTTLRLLVQPYAEHPDFDPAWRVS